jgi:AcrR family transcriptional regulator
MQIDYPLGEFPITIRDEQKEQTRARILNAALALIRDGGEEAVTIRGVATLAGITERTVFRHYGNRNTLLLAAWQRLRELVAPPLPRTADALIEAARRLFPRLEQLGSLARAYLHRRKPRAGRRRRDKSRQQLLLDCVRHDVQYFGYVSDRMLRRRAAIAELICSPYAWELMQESWGFSGKEAGRAAAEALEILLNRRLP